MKAKELLKEVVRMGSTEAQGIAVSSPFETQGEFVARWFGDCQISGGYKNDAEYLYSYGECLEGVADMVLEMQDGTPIFLYEIE